MKGVLISILLLASSSVFAQSFYDNSNSTGQLRLGGGYTHDFPGLNGYHLMAEYGLPVSPWLQAAFGLKRFRLQGTPRSAGITEYTRASTLDFGLYLLPLSGYRSQIRLGLGYSFVFYDVLRSYPVFSGTDKTAEWNAKASSGRCSGLNLSADYEYAIPESAFSVGLRVAWYKAYDRVTSVGPYLAVAL